MSDMILEKLNTSLVFTDEMYEALLQTSAKNILDNINKEDPTLSLKPFVERCLNSIKNNGVKATMRIYDVPMGFLENIEKAYLKHN